MSLKKYNDFIKESNSDFEEVEKILLVRSYFVEMLLEMSDMRMVGKTSYSDLCKTDKDPESDFKKMQSFMDSKGFNIDKIKELFSEENNHRCGFSLIDIYEGNKQELNTREDLRDVRTWISNNRTFPLNGLDSDSATVDVYLYKLFEKLGLDKNIVELGGPGWSDWTGGDSDEALIRYRYGYHQTKYGQLMIEQNGKTAEDLKSDAIKELKNEISSEFDRIIERIIQKKLGKKISLSIDFNQFVVMEDDRMIIFCKEIAQKITQNLSDMTDQKFDDEDVYSEFTKSLQWFKLSNEDDQTMQIIDGDLILWGDFGI